jgi:hypothetical protein
VMPTPLLTNHAKKPRPISSRIDLWLLWQTLKKSLAGI